MQIQTHTMLLGLALATLGGCASQPAPRYFEARPVFKPQPAPAVVTVPQPVPLPGQLRRIPPPNKPAPPATGPCLTNPDANHGIEEAAGKEQAHKKGAKKARGADVGDCDEVAARISRANARATQNPAEEGFFNAISVLDYDPGTIYQVYGAVLRLTTISLQPGEKLMDPPSAGDTTRWILDFKRSMAVGRDGNPVEQIHITLHPTRSGLDTTFLITTDRRVYHLELHSFEKPNENVYMVSLAWRYPQDEIANFKVAAAAAVSRENQMTGTAFDPTKAYYNYEVKPEKRTPPAWTPQQVFDDGQHTTYIRFPRSVLNSEVPALYVLSSTGEIQLTNFSTKNEYYLVQGIFPSYELRLGQKKQEIVRIYRR
jgi:P-type conjugative transfer protein TrbG